MVPPWCTYNLISIVIQAAILIFRVKKITSDSFTKNWRWSALWMTCWKNFKMLALDCWTISRCRRTISGENALYADVFEFLRKAHSFPTSSPTEPAAELNNHQHFRHFVSPFQFFLRFYSISDFKGCILCIKPTGPVPNGCKRLSWVKARVLNRKRLREVLGLTKNLRSLWGFIHHGCTKARMQQFKPGWVKTQFQKLAT